MIERGRPLNLPNPSDAPHITHALIEFSKTTHTEEEKTAALSWGCSKVLEVASSIGQTVLLLQQDVIDLRRKFITPVDR